ncbi:MAG: hypothetical protein NTV28_03645 [Propionibacteriales bacterium]|nr:hypothetical protein [Propionibacteriales bacterium]
MTPRQLGTTVAALALLTAGCAQPVDVDGAARWRDRADEAARSALLTVGERVTLAPDDTLSGRADTQRCPGRGSDAVVHRVDATLDLASAPPSGLADAVRASVPSGYDVEVDVQPDRVVLGVVSRCLDLPRIQTIEMALEGRYRVEP